MMYVNKISKEITPWLNSRLHSVSEFPSATLAKPDYYKADLMFAE